MSKWKNEIKLNGRYGIAGILNGCVGVGLIVVFTSIGIVPTLANFLGFLVGLVFAFTISRKFVFKSENHLNSEAIRYLTAFVICYSINMAVLQLCVLVFFLDTMLSQIIAVSFYVFSMYVASRIYIFSEKNHE